MNTKTTGKSTGQAATASASAGARHGSNAKTTGERADRGESADEAAAKTPSGLNENTGEFRVGEKIIFGMRNGNILIRHSPQGDEVEVGEATLAGLMIDAFFTDKFGSGNEADYPTVQAPSR